MEPSDEFLVRVLESKSTVFEAWTRFRNLFHNNKGAHAAALDQEFTNITLCAFSTLETYCHFLKEIVDQLNYVGCLVDESRLVL